MDGRWDEFPFVKILPGDDVFVGLPICKMGFQAQFRQAVLVTKENDIPIAIELEDLKQKLAHTRLFYFVADEKGVLSEVEPKDAKLTLRLPKETNINELVFMNGEVLKQEVHN